MISPFTYHNIERQQRCGNSKLGWGARDRHVRPGLARLSPVDIAIFHIVSIEIQRVHHPLVVQPCGMLAAHCSPRPTLAGVRLDNDV